MINTTPDNSVEIVNLNWCVLIPSLQFCKKLQQNMIYWKKLHVKNLLRKAKIKQINDIILPWRKQQNPILYRMKNSTGDYRQTAPSFSTWTPDGSTGIALQKWSCALRVPVSSPRKLPVINIECLLSWHSDQARGNFCVTIVTNWQCCTKLNCSKFNGFRWLNEHPRMSRNSWQSQFFPKKDKGFNRTATTRSESYS